MSTNTGDDGRDPEVDEVEARIGMKVGTYVLTKRLGHGGMGAVYAAEHPTIGSRVAVKFLHRKYAADPSIVDRFFNEARAVNVIGHENIVKVSDLDFAPDGSPYFVMEFLEGRALADLTGTPQPLSDMGPIFLQACDALAAAHDKGIVHRDLKPDNLFLVTQRRRANVVKIVDFGIAKLQGNTGGAKTSTGMILGTAHYMSPEQAGGEVNRIGPASDVFAMGVIMFQMATGRLPFDGGNLGQIIVGILTRPAPDPREFEPGVPDDYAAVIMKCLEKRIEDRYESMHALYDAIAAVLDTHGLPHEPPAAKGLTPASNPNLQAFSPTPAPRMPTPAPRPPTPAPRAPTPAPRPASNPGTHILPQSHPGTELINANDARPGFTVLNDSVRDSTPGHTVVKPGAARPPSMPPTAVVPPAYASLPAAAPAKKSPVVPVVVVLLVVVAGAAWFATRRSAEAVPAPAAAPVAAAPATQAAPTPTVATSVKLTIESTPPDAKVVVTQGELTTRVLTPATLPVTPGVEVKLQGELAGHEPVTVTVKPGNDQTVTLAFSKLPPPAPKPTAPVAAPTPSPAAPKQKPAAAKPVGDQAMDIDL